MKYNTFVRNISKSMVTLTNHDCFLCAQSCSNCAFHKKMKLSEFQCSLRSGLTPEKRKEYFNRLKFTNPELFI